MFAIPAERLACTAASSGDCRPGLLNATPATPCHRPAQQAHARRLVCTAQSTETTAGDRFDVGAAVINPAYRSTPWQAEAAEEGSDRTHVRSQFHTARGHQSTLRFDFVQRMPVRCNDWPARSNSQYQACAGPCAIDGFVLHHS